jgi:hypothetical protein
MTLAQLAASGGPGCSEVSNNQLQSTLAIQSGFGGYYDFVVNGLSLGDTAYVTLPVAGGLPINAFYQKFKGNIWAPFVLTKLDDNVEVEHGKIFSTLSVGGGVCPAVPADPALDPSPYTSGLKTGDDCVLLAIIDGGFNDGDGVANGAVVSLGTIGQNVPLHPPFFSDDPGVIDIAPGVTASTFGFDDARLSIQNLINAGFPDDVDVDILNACVGFCVDLSISTSSDTVEFLLFFDQPIPLTPGSYIWRLFSLNSFSWIDFDLSMGDSIATAPLVDVMCPDAVSGEYVAGIHPGHQCVKIVVTDDSENDNDMSLGAIEFLGGIAEIPPGPPDADDDGVLDADDNCTNVANPNQRDSDGDGYGNFCDADLNNDGVITVFDFLLLRSRLNSTDADADLNGDGFVTVVDYLMLRSMLNQSPGPSALAP